MKLPLISLSILTLALACSAPSPEVGSTSSPILFRDIFGTTAILNSRPTPTGSLLEAQTNTATDTTVRTSCSLTFVSPTLALTAAHCVADNAPRPWMSGGTQTCPAGMFPYQMYRPTQDFNSQNFSSIEQVNTGVKANGPSTWQEWVTAAKGGLQHHYTADIGYNVDGAQYDATPGNACCQVVAHENDDLAMVECGPLTFGNGTSGAYGGAKTFQPGVVYGTVEAEHQAPTKPGRALVMPWTDEIVNPFNDDGLSVNDYHTEVYAHYISDQGVGNNFHYMTASDLMPLTTPAAATEVTEDLDRWVTALGCTGIDGAPALSVDTGELVGIQSYMNELIDPNGGARLICQASSNSDNQQLIRGSQRLYQDFGLFDDGGMYGAVTQIDWYASNIPYATFAMNDFNRDQQQRNWALENTATFVKGAGTGQGRDVGTLVLNAGDQAMLAQQDWEYLVPGHAYAFSFRIAQNLGSNYGPETNSVSVTFGTASGGPLAVATVQPASMIPRVVTAQVAVPTSASADYYIQLNGNAGSVSVSEIALRDTNEPFYFLTADERNAWDLRPAGSNYDYETYNTLGRAPMMFSGSNGASVNNDPMQAFVGVLSAGQRMESRNLGIPETNTIHVSFAIPRIFASNQYPANVNDLLCGVWYQDGSTIKVPCAPSSFIQTNGVWSATVSADIGTSSQPTLPPEGFFIELPFPTQSGVLDAAIEISKLSITTQQCSGTGATCSVDGACCNYAQDFCSGACYARGGAGQGCVPTNPRSCQSGLTCVLGPDGFDYVCQ